MAPSDSEHNNNLELRQEIHKLYRFLSNHDQKQPEMPLEDVQKRSKWFACLIMNSDNEYFTSSEQEVQEIILPFLRTLTIPRIIQICQFITNGHYVNHLKHLIAICIFMLPPSEIREILFIRTSSVFWKNIAPVDFHLWKTI